MKQSIIYMLGFRSISEPRGRSAIFVCLLSSLPDALRRAAHQPCASAWHEKRFGRRAPPRDLQPSR